MTDSRTHPLRIDPEAFLAPLVRWYPYAEQHYYALPDHPGLGCFGTGYNHNWGIQTDLKYVGAMGALAVLSREAGLLSEEVAAQARVRALAVLRYDLRTHVSGDLRRTDGAQWGHFWISGLGIERAMFGIYLLEPYLADEDRQALRRVLCSEADWLLDEYEVVADPWGKSGKNKPESNMWNGAILWRAGASYPDHPHAAIWQERAHDYLINAISVAADATDERALAGRPIRERHVGAQFFPHYSLDHHGYMNVGYMVITLSNLAMLHYDLAAQGWAASESLYHHDADLWRTLRRMIFPDGRLARIGGDSRVRYTYCQEYLLPALVYAADRLGDPHALGLARGFLGLIEQEMAFSGDGSFYARRLSNLADNNPYYHVRLESDRAAVLAMAAAYLRRLETTGATEDPTEAREAFERSVAGGWAEPEHGAVLHRSAARLAAYTWTAHGLTQGTCQPPDDSHLAEWEQNLCSVVRLQGDDGTAIGTHRRLEGQRIETFEGGFLTYGAVTEGLNLAFDEGWRGEQPAQHSIAFAALPDGHTVLGLERIQALDRRVYVTALKGLHLNLPNDLYNGLRRTLHTPRGEVLLESPPDQDQVLSLGGRWANVEGRVGVVGLYGARELAVHRTCQRRGGKYRSLYVEEICWPCAQVQGSRAADAGAVLLDVGWAVLSSADPTETEAFARQARIVADDGADDGLRAVAVTGLDGREYLLAFNTSSEPICTAMPEGTLRDLATGAPVVGGEAQLAAREARLFVREG